MKKVNLRVKLVSDEDNIDNTLIGYQDDNKINYKDDKVDVTIVVNHDKINMKRVSNEYCIELLFDKHDKTISTYQVFGGTKTFALETKTKKLIINTTKIMIDYSLEGNDFSYTLEMEDL